MALEPNTLVKLKKTGGPVQVRLALDGLGADWSYTYVTESGRVQGKSTDGGGPERVHPLGTPTALHAHAHTWDLAVGRVGEDEVPFTATLTWEQDLDGDGRFEAVHRRVFTTDLNDGNEADTFRSGVFLLTTAAVQPLAS